MKTEEISSILYELDGSVDEAIAKLKLYKKQHLESADGEYCDLQIEVFSNGGTELLLYGVKKR